MSDGQGPDFNWLYTGSGTPPQEPTQRSPRRARSAANAPAETGAGEPEMTRALPVQQRPNGAGGPGAVPPTTTLRKPPAGIPASPPAQPPTTPRGTEYGGGGGRGPRLRRPRLKWIIRIAVLLLVAWIGFLVWLPISASKDFKHVAWEPSGARPAKQPGTTYLIVGSDSRAGLTAKQRKKLHTGGDVGQRTDTIKLLHTGSGPNLLMTIPRDSYVPIPGRGSSKINAAFAWGGPQLLVKTIEQNTGVRIDGYVEIGMGGLVQLVDGVGGITICPTKNMNDPLANLHVKKGCQPADGVTALAYSRSRHAQQLGDLGRGEAQSEVIGQIGKKALTVGTVINPFKLDKLKNAATSGIIVGDGMGIVDLGKFAWAFKSVAGGSAMTCGIPISDMYVHWDKTRALKMLSFIKTDTVKKMPASLCTPSGLPASVTG